MATDYLPFAYEHDANVITQEEWAVLADRPGGFKRGPAISKNFNKDWRQATVMAAALAQFIDENVPGDVVDDGDVNALAGLIADAIAALNDGGVSLSPTMPANPVPGQLWFDPVTTQLYIYYDDTVTQQWVVVTNQPTRMDGGPY